MQKKIPMNSKKSFQSCITLYVFLLFFPIFVIPVIFSEIPFSNNTVKILSFLYSVLSSLISYFHYQRLEKLPQDKISKFKKTFWAGILVLFTYFFTTTFHTFPLLLLNPDLSKIPLITKIIYLIIFEIIQLLLIIYILKDKLIKDFQDIKKNHKSYYSTNIKYYFLALIVMVSSNLIISFFNNGNIAGNEEAIRQTFSLAPFYMYFSGVFIAPLLEELVFRQGLRNIFTNKKLFIIISGLVFGGLHVVGNINSPIDLLYLIPYCAPGFAFAYMLAKTDNIFVSSGFHFLHNGVTMSLQFLLLILGI